MYHKSLNEHLAYARRNRPYGMVYVAKPVQVEDIKKKTPQPKKTRAKKEPEKDDNVHAD